MSTVDTVAAKMSRIGKKVIVLPSGVTVNVQGTLVEVKGPKGTLARSIPSTVKVNVEDKAIAIQDIDSRSNFACLQGMTRAHIANMVVGVSEGYQRALELVGTGYRAEVKGQHLHLSLGFSHQVIFELPESVKANVPADSKGTLINLTSNNKDLIGQIAAKIRSFRPPEPYGGKGVRYRGENIRRKAGKAGKGGKK